MEIREEIAKEVTKKLVEEEVQKAQKKLRPVVKEAVLKVFESNKFKEMLKIRVQKELSGFDFIEFLPKSYFNSLMKKAVMSLFKKR